MKIWKYLFAIALAHVSTFALADCGVWANVTIAGLKSGTVTGNPVKLTYYGLEDYAMYLDGNLFGYMGQFGSWPVTANLSVGTHTVTMSGYESCTRTFDVVAVPSGQQAVYSFDWSASSDYFSTLSYSEGAAFAGYLGIGFTTFTSPIDGDMQEIFRCWAPSETNHFVSNSSGCEGLTYEGSYGYVSSIPRTGFVPLYRHYHSGRHDHITTTNASMGSGWVLEGVQGWVTE